MENEVQLFAVIVEQQLHRPSFGINFHGFLKSICARGFRVLSILSFIGIILILYQTFGVKVEIVNESIESSESSSMDANFDKTPQSTSATITTKFTPTHTSTNEIWNSIP